MNAAADSTTAKPLCQELDAEELAAFLDRRLPEERCRLVRAHLAACEDCYQVFAGVLESVAGDEPREEGAGILFPVPRRSRGTAARGDVTASGADPRTEWRPPRDGESAAGRVVPGWFPRGSALAWVGVAAAAVVCVAAGLALWPRPAPRPVVAELTAGLSGTLRGGKLKAAAFWAPHFRGSGDGPEVSSIEQSFRLGVALFELDLSLEERERSAAQDARAHVWGLAKDLASPRVEEFYTKTLLKALEKGDPDPQILAEARAMAESGFKDSADAFYLALGEWTEAGRLAVLSERRQFFEGEKNRRFLDSAMKRLKSESAGIDDADRSAPSHPSESGGVVSDEEEKRVKGTLTALGEIAREWGEEGKGPLKGFEDLLRIYDPHGGSAAQGASPDLQAPPARTDPARPGGP